MIGVGDEPFAEPDIGQRVVIGGCAIALGVEGGIDEADVREGFRRHRVDERRVVTGIPTASVSSAAKGCQNGKYFVPHSARKGMSRKKYPPVGMPTLLGIGDNWSQMVGSAEIVNELWSRSVRAACW